MIRKRHQSHFPAGKRAFTASLGALAFLGTLGVACIAVEGPADDGQTISQPAPGAIRGEVVSYILTMENGSMEEHLYLRTDTAATEQRLLFAQPPKFEPGQRIDVWGESVADGLRVARFANVAAPVSAIQTAQKPLISGAPLKPRRFAFVLVDLGGGVNIAKAEAERRLFGLAGTDRSVRQYFMEASYGRQDVGGDVIGPIKGTMTGCNFQALATALRPQITGEYDHYLWYFGSRVPSCGFLGVALSGTPARVSRDTWYNASTECVVLVQEPAHNFGTMHSSTTKCRDGSVFADVPGGGTMGTCTHNEYGDPYDPMGRGCRHMNSYQKAFQGWFGGCNVVDVTATETFTLLPIETPCDGVQALQIKMPKVRPFSHTGGGGSGGISTTELTHYYLEYRTPVGFDAGISPAVQIRVSGDIRQRTQRGFHTWLLDMNPVTTAFEGLVAGGSFTDPAGGTKFTVMALDAKQATVRVEILNGTGAPTCMDGTPLPMPAPGPESCNATPARPVGSAPIVVPDGGPPVPRDGGGTSDGSGDGRGDSGLLPLGFDAGVAEGFKDASSSSGSGGSTGSSSGAGGSGSRSGGSTGQASGGGIGTSAAAPTNVQGSGCSVHPSGLTGGAPFVAPGLLLLSLFLRRRRSS